MHSTENQYVQSKIQHFFYFGTALHCIIPLTPKISSPPLSLSNSSPTHVTPLTHTSCIHLQRTDLKHRRPRGSGVVRDGRITTRQHNVRLARNGRRAVRGRRDGKGEASVDGGRAVGLIISINQIINSDEDVDIDTGGGRGRRKRRRGV